MLEVIIVEILIVNVLDYKFSKMGGSIPFLILWGEYNSKVE